MQIEFLSLMFEPQNNTIPYLFWHEVIDLQLSTQISKQSNATKIRKKNIYKNNFNRKPVKENKPIFVNLPAIVKLFPCLSGRDYGKEHWGHRTQLQWPEAHSWLWLIVLTEKRFKFKSLF